MGTGRLEALSDGVLAIIITIMVLELKVPHEPTWHALGDTSTGLVTYLLSFVYIGIYWSNHHHMLQLCSRVSGGVLWANLHLLFWLSLYPFTTAWMDETDVARVPVLLYGVNRSSRRSPTSSCSARSSPRRVPNPGCAGLWVVT